MYNSVTFEYYDEMPRRSNHKKNTISLLNFLSQKYDFLSISSDELETANDVDTMQPHKRMHPF